MEEKIYDVIVIGGGPAAVSAGIYAYRSGLDTLVIAANMGGQIAESGYVENYPGIEPLPGEKLAEKLWQHLDKTGVKSKMARVRRLWRRDDGIFIVETRKTYLARTVIIATGREHRKLEVPGAEEYEGRGVHYCATCDGPLYEGMEVAVIGGGNSAIDAALQLKKICPRVHIINLGSEIRGEAVRVKLIKEAKNVVVHNNAMVTGIIGDGKKMTGLKYKDKDGSIHEIPVVAAFVEIGTIPTTDYIELNVKKNKDGEIEVNERCETNIPGLFAAGDVTNVLYKQAIIAAGEGAKAALSAFMYLQEGKSQ